MLGRLHMIGFLSVCTGVMIGMNIIFIQYYRDQKSKMCCMCRSNQIGKLNEQSNTVEYIAYTTGSPQGIAVDPFHRCVV